MNLRDGLKDEKSVKRCAWVPLDKPDYVAYHDTEWGQPVRDDRLLFEMLILEGAQAGLSWYTILRRREEYRAAFHNFDVTKCARMTDAYLEKVLLKSGVILNRLKVYSVRTNARVFAAIQKEFGSFDAYLWSFVGGMPIVHRPATLKGIPPNIPASVALSKDLKRRGMSFVGGSIAYAYMQAVGLVNDHMRDCHYAEPDGISTRAR